MTKKQYYGKLKTSKCFFTFTTFTARVRIYALFYIVEEKVLFNANDVGTILGLKDVKSSIRNFNENQKVLFPKV